VSTAAATARLSPVLGRTRSALARLESLPVPRVLAVFVAVEWLAILGTALTVGHSGWIYYQGGDQLWYYTLAWQVVHGHLTQTLVGYLWPAALAPLAAAAGANLVSAFPVIVLVDVLVLMPVAMFALYGIASRIGGRIFAYWVMLLWVVLPFIGVLYTNQGYHARYTELFLPQAFGLTAMADFPTMVFALVAAYFCARVIFDDAPAAFDGVAAGVAAGAAIGVKPATALFLLGPALAFLAVRRFAFLGWFLAGLAPSLVTLTVWKARGLGNVPLLHALPQSGHDGLASAAPLLGLGLHRYTHLLNWSKLGNNIDLLREHFWSGRLIVWFVLAGVVGLARRSPRAALLVGGWFGAFVLVKGTYEAASVEDSSLFRIMMPAYPAFVLLIASIPLLLPHFPGKLTAPRPAFGRPSARTRWTLLAVAVLATAVLPLGAIAAATTGRSTGVAFLNASYVPVPADVDIGLRARRANGSVTLRWNAQHPLGGPVFYRVWRAKSDGFSCPPRAGAPLCNITMPEVGVTHDASFVDKAPPGRWVYRVAVAANWLNDPTFGDPYLISRAVSVR
jgi:hypothetical protein